MLRRAVCIAITLFLGLNAAAQTTTDYPIPRRAIIVYGSIANADACATLLRDAGLAFQLLPQQDWLARKWNPDADLIVFLACCQGGYATPISSTNSPLRGIEKARVLACGDVGASILQTKALLIGHPNGWHNKSTNHQVRLQPGSKHELIQNLLCEPNALIRGSTGSVDLALHANNQEIESIAIYDGGEFPDGTLGLVMEVSDSHHWTVCKQGNFALWGLGGTINDLTDEGRLLFVNLCVALANAEPEALKFPDAVFLEAGSHEGVLRGGAQDSYHYSIQTNHGLLTLRLEWDLPVEMTLITAEPVWSRVDGTSPLAITQHIQQTDMDIDCEISVHSFKLPNDELCPYTLSITLE